MDIPRGYTALILHWPTARSAGEVPPLDQTFLIRGIHTGERFHRIVDALLEEHAPYTGDSDCITEITAFRHLPSGGLDHEQFLSHYYAA